MSLEVMAKLSNSDQKGIDELLNFQVSSFSSHEDFADIVQKFLNFVFFLNKHCTYCYWRDEQVYDELFIHGKNCEQGRQSEVFLKLLKCHSKLLFFLKILKNGKHLYANLEINLLRADTRLVNCCTLCTFLGELIVSRV